ncbi:Histone-lysine N-methyltransferase SETMAR [Ooceraea biroi]|uniref:Histone-lysine N-methyltransferase SETMAR n=1 Tax=Ooceraea biroi TaxID=2015173 RepID=A0A026X1Z7_OOCBI|nr:Histone-lysine N-methyltransferase SETMAR [Ooceraea biroi]
MEDQKVHFRHILLFFFRKGVKATDAQREICGVYGDSAISAEPCQRWFARFRSGDVNVSDAAHSGRLSTTDDDQIVAAIKADRHLTTREIAERFDIVKLQRCLSAELSLAQLQTRRRIYGNAR